jgi:hypothetical protein
MFGNGRSGPQGDCETTVVVRENLWGGERRVREDVLVVKKPAVFPSNSW